jgi:4-hydroxybenzoate polyprenyltransferase
MKPMPRLDSAMPLGKPLCVDLDGTLLATDLLWESIILLLRNRAITLLRSPLWLSKGRAHFKRKIAESVTLNPASLPYREDVISFLKKERSSGREIILATASDQHNALLIADYLGIFSTVVASDGEKNLSGYKKLEAIKNHVGCNPFDYIGDARIDIPLWQEAHNAILVHPPARLLRRVSRMATVQQVFPSQGNWLRHLIKAIRVQQWSKNLLLFVPLLLAHRVTDIAAIIHACYAFVAFSLCASSVYIVNDLLDLESDRLHPLKKSRPFASGSLQLKTGISLVPLFLAISFSVSLVLLTPLFSAALLLYLITTTAYSFYFKRLAIFDVVLLAGLYTLRIVVGGIATGIHVTPWLLGFSMFFFLSLAFVKRYAELRVMQLHKRENNCSRGYLAEDVELLRIAGSTSGYLSVLVLALYINNNDVARLYANPTLLWLIGPCLLYWITRIWLLASRGVMQDDPIVFTAKDRASYVVGLITVLIVAAAAIV